MNSGAGAARSRRPHPWLAPLFLVLFTFVMYSGALGFDFLNYDDLANVAANHHLVRLGAEDFKWMFTGTAVLDYKPMVWLSYAADRLIWGMAPMGFHLGNIVLHAANVLLVFWIALFLLRRSGPAGLAEAGAALLALLFAVHPQRVESVVWISERKDVLYGFFYLASIAVYLRWTQAPRRSAYWGFTILGILSMLSKPMAVTLPVILLLLDGLLGRRNAGRLAIEKGPLFVAALLMSVRTVLDHLGDRSLSPVVPLASTPIPGVGLAATLWMLPYGLVFYLKKTFWPVDLSPLYPPQSEVGFTMPYVLSAALVIALTAVFAIAWMRGSRWPLFLWLFFAVAILPALPSRNVADRFTYLPSLGLLGMAAGVWLLVAVRASRVVLVTLALAVVAWLAVLNWNYAGWWGASESLWRYTVSRTPSARAWYLLAQARFADGQYRQAVRSAGEALKIDPQMAVAWNLKGAIFAKMNRAPEAEESFRQATRLHGDMWEAYENLGTLLMTQGQADEAIESWEQALKLNPDAFTSHVGLARAYRDRRRNDLALSHVQAALALWPSADWLREEMRALQDGPRPTP